MNIYNNKKSTNNQIIYTVSALCGTGKTYATIKYIKENKNKNILYVAPTKKLLHQTAKDIHHCDLIASDGNRTPVKTRIINYLQSVSELNSIGNVLLITHKSYFDLPSFIDFSEWEIFIDEVPQVDHYLPLNLKHHPEILDEYLTIDEHAMVTSDITRVFPRDRNKLEYLVKEKSKVDDIYAKVFKELFQFVLNDNYDVFVDMKNSLDGRVAFIAMMKPNRFYGATLLGANIEHSMLYDWFTRFHNVRFVNNDSISCHLRENNNNIEDRLNIQYFLEGKKWSKSLRDKTVKGKSIIEEIEKRILKEIGDNDFLLVANNDYKGLLDKQGIRIPVDSKGSNDYTDYNYIVSMPALNREPLHYNILDRLGFTDEIIDSSTGYEILYQNIMRTSLRNPDSNQIVNIITPSSYEADFIVSIVGGNKKQIFDVEYKKYSPLTNNQKMTNKRANQTLKSWTVGGEINDINDNHVWTNMSQNVPHLSYKTKKGYKMGQECEHINNNINITPPTNQRLYVCQLTKYENTIDNYIFESMDYMGLKKFLKLMSKRSLKNKEQCYLINPSIYRPTDPEHYRNKENYIASNILILDFDNGELSIEQFESIFKDYSFIITNSFSRSEEQPNRFRVYMPIDRMCNYSEYQSAYDFIESMIDNPNSGLDKSCRSPVQSYYLPAINREHSDYYYFNTNHFDKSARIKPIIIDNIKKIFVDQPIKKKIKTPSKKNKQKQIEKVKQEYLSIPKGQGKRNHAFYIAGLSLLNYCTLEEIEIILRELAGNDSKMLNRIENNMKQYRKKMNYGV